MEENCMRLIRVIGISCALLFWVAVLTAQQNESAEASKPAEKTAEKSGKAPAEAEKAAAIKEEPPVVTHHEIHVGGRILHYTATTGYMPIRNEEGTEIEANIFFMAYTLDNPAAKRPLMFSFNGGLAPPRFGCTWARSARDG
jgi:carboxypeptidase C (cathepsin A)